jgi:hypothetical protein
MTIFNLGIRWRHHQIDAPAALAPEGNSPRAPTAQEDGWVWMLMKNRTSLTSARNQIPISQSYSL